MLRIKKKIDKYISAIVYFIIIINKRSICFRIDTLLYYQVYKIIMLKNYYVFSNSKNLFLKEKNNKNNIIFLKNHKI